MAIAELDVDLMQPGADLVADSERAQKPVLEVADLEADIAPAGSRLAPEKAPSPPAPNVDHIQMAD